MTYNWKYWGPLLFLPLLLSVPMLDSKGDGIIGYNPPLVLAVVAFVILFLLFVGLIKLPNLAKNPSAMSYIVFSFLSLFFCIFSPVSAVEAVSFQLKLIVLGLVVFTVASMCRSIDQIRMIVILFVGIWLFIYIIGFVMYVQPGKVVHLFGLDLKPRIDYWHYDRYRMISIVGNTYVMAHSFVIYFAFCFLGRSLVEVKGGYLFYNIALVVGVIACVLTFSKAAFLILIVMVSCYFILFERSTLLRILPKILFVLLVFVGLLAITSSYLSDSYSVNLLRGGIDVVFHFSLDNPLGRNLAWNAGLGAANSAGMGMFGVGSGQMYYLMEEVHGFASGVDSGFLLTFLEKGVFGFIGMLALWSIAIVDSLKRAVMCKKLGVDRLTCFYQMKLLVLVGLMLYEIPMQTFDTIGYRFIMLLFIFALRPNMDRKPDSKITRLRISDSYATSD